MSAPADRRVTLVLPGLLDLSAAEYDAAFAHAGALPELETFFSRARRQRFSHAGFDAVMFALFGVPLAADEDLPVAAVSYVGETGKTADNWCVRADPVQLIPDRDQLVLMGPESLSLSQAEAEQLATELNAQFAQDGWRIEACTPTHWSLQLADVPSVRTHALAQVRGQTIGDYLPVGADGKQWHRFLNEVQMVLHSSAVNQQRQSRGQVAVSSLWFWGGGKTPEVAHSRWSLVWSHEALALGLASLSGTPCKALPENATSWLSTAILPGEHLIVQDDLLRSWQGESPSTWAQQLHAFNREWIAPLLHALRNKEISELCIHACNGCVFTLSRADLRRWWRRKRSLAFIAANI